MPVKHSGLPPDKWIAEAQKRLRQLPLKVANTAHRHFARNFETESWEGQKWPPRSPWAVRNQGRHLLRDTGTLFRALSKEVSGSRIRIFIALPANLPPLHPMFRINVGINPIIYSPRHPYFASIPSGLRQKIKNHSEDLITTIPTKQKVPSGFFTRKYISPAEKKAVYAMPMQEQFYIVETYKNGGSVEVHRTYVPSNDHEDVLRAARMKAMEGNNVKLLPVIVKEEKAARDLLMPGHKGNSNADLLVNNSELWEIEKPSTPVSLLRIQSRIKDGYKQANHILILIDEEYPIKILNNEADKQFRDVARKDLKALEFAVKGKIVIKRRRQ